MHASLGTAQAAAAGGILGGAGASAPTTTAPTAKFTFGVQPSAGATGGWSVRFGCRGIYSAGYRWPR